MTAQPQSPAVQPWDGIGAHPDLIGLPRRPAAWPFLGIMTQDDRSRGLAVLVSPTTAVTEKPVSATAILVDNTSHSVSLVSESDGLCTWTLDPPAKLLPDQRPPLVQTPSAAACVIVQVDDAMPSVVLSSGTVSLGSKSESGTVSGFGYSEFRTAMGSPVLVDNGILTLVGTRGTNSSVETAQISRDRLDAAWLGAGFPQTSPRELPFSPGAKAILDEAMLMQSWRENPVPAVGSLVLCAAIVEAARRDDGTVLSVFVRGLEAGGGLASRLGLRIRERRLETDYVRAAYGPPLIDLATRAIELAHRLGSSGVHARHVLGAAVTDDTALAPGLLHAVRTSPADLRRILRTAVDDCSPDDDPGVWNGFLASSISAPDLQGGTTTDFVDPTQPIPLDRDTMGMRTYVRMIADLIASRQTPMPLSVGLFGAWGSGKSFFMGMLRAEIARLSRDYPATHCTEVAHVGFNAWTYSDTNLWASLGDEIFRQLLHPDGKEQDEEQQRIATQRAQLERELQTKREARAELLAAKDQAVTETARARDDLAEARKESAQHRVDLLQAAKDSSLVREELGEALRRLGLSDEAQQAAALVTAMEESADDIAALAKTTQQRRTRWFVGAGLLILAISGVLAYFAPRLAASVGLAGISSVLAAAVAAVGWTRSGVAKLREVVAKLQAADAQSAAKETRSALDAYRQAQTREAGIEAQLATVTQRAEQIGHDLEVLRSDARLFSFLLDRAESPEYQGNLGLISIVRRDLARLKMLMDDWRKHPEPGRTPIDRIVLYIDDLDRCEPDQVVEVLQAVHLLLAHDLFIVVVGVDPRWMVRSLRKKYPATLDETVPPGRSADGGVTPEDYLEKIFNIPFVLPRMDPDAFGRLVSSIVDAKSVETEGEGRDAGAAPDVPGDTPDTTLEGGDDGPESAAPASGTTPASGTPAISSRLVPASIDIEDASSLAASSTQAVAAPAAPLTLDDDEKTMLAAVGALLETPREGTRVLNLYRMLRSTRDLSPSREFLGSGRRAGEYQAVIVLLAMLTAHPHLMGAFLDEPPSPDRGDPAAPRGGILHWARVSTWADVIDGVVIAPGAATNRICAIRAADIPDWRRLAAGLEPTRSLITLPDLAAFQKWAPKVARFSFLLLPVAGQQPRV